MRVVRLICSAVCAALLGTGVWAESSDTFNCENLPALKSKAQEADGEAQYQLARLYSRGECVDRDVNQGAQWLKKSVGQHNDKAEALLAMIMHETNRDKEAVDLATQSANQGNIDGAALLAALYANGEGGNQDDYQAVRWAQFAAQYNNYLAELVLADLYANGRGGLPHSSVQADKWLIIADQIHSPGSNVPSLRTQLEHSMSTAEIAAAKQKAAEWKPRERAEK